MWETMTAVQLAQVGLIGLVAGVLGGMLGVGGSVIMIPALVLVFGRSQGGEQHLYQAAAMIANVALSVPAFLRHRKAGAIRLSVLKWMIPAALVFVILGVVVSNLPIFGGAAGGLWLGRLLAVFLLYVIFINVRRLLWPLRPRVADDVDPVPPSAGEDHAFEPPLITPARGGTVGAVMGFAAGLLGIGGGALALPLQQALLHLPLRSCIANSSATICLSGALGAAYKNLTLAQHATAGLPLDFTSGLTLGLTLAPTAWIGGRLGAALTHTLPIKAVRAAFIALLIVAAWKMAGL